MSEAIIVDIDGTIAIRGDRSPYDWGRVSEDTPNTPVIRIIDALAAANRDLRIVYVSGRSNICEEDTRRWIDIHAPFPDALYMRKDGDMRPDEIVKEDIYQSHIEDEYRVLAVFDDRNKVVAMWRSLGLTVFQVADGDF